MGPNHTSSFYILLNRKTYIKIRTTRASFSGNFMNSLPSNTPYQLPHQLHLSFLLIRKNKSLHLFKPLKVTAANIVFCWLSLLFPSSLDIQTCVFGTVFGWRGNWWQEDISVAILILEDKKKMKSPFSELDLPNRLLDSIAQRMPHSQENLPVDLAFH